MEHKPVLLHEVIANLSIHSDGIYVDGTLGAGGHASAIVEQLSTRGRLIACDLDPLAISHGENIFRDAHNVTLVRDSFKHIPEILGTNHINQVDGILLDLGWNSDQFTDASRGFSFQEDGPLDMTFDQASDSPDRLTASIIINTWDERELADTLYKYADEGFSRRIAQAIVENRKKSPIISTTELAKIITDAVPAFYRHRRIHPATKTFQALRIAVNDEINVLESSITNLVKKLRQGGRLLIITFHSIEDRIVKRAFRELENDGYGNCVIKRGITASASEISQNPRSRSARLRIFEKNNTYE